MNLPTLCVLLTLCAVAPLARGQSPWVQTHEIVPPDSAYLDHFAKGHALALSGDTLVAGAPQKPVSPAPGEVQNAGQVDVYRRDGTGWARQAVLFEPGGPSFVARFGEAVALQGDTLVIGAPQSSVQGFGGAAYVFVREGWDWVAQAGLVSGVAGTAKFGRALALEADTLAVAAPAAQSGAVPAVTVFEHAADGTWLTAAVLTPPEGASPIGFGSALALSGERLAVSWPAAKCVLLYTRDASGTWSLERQVEPPGGAVGDFGSALDLDARRLVVGEPIAGAIGYGVAHVFALPDALHTAVLPSPSFASPFFGGEGSLSLWGDRIAVGATHDHEFGPVAGSVSLFRWDGQQWALEQLLGTGQIAAHFGSCALEGGRLVVGAFGDDVGSQAGPGRVHVFEPDVPGVDDLGGGLPGACEAPLLAADSEFTPGSALRLSLSGAAPGAAVWFVVGDALVWQPLHGGLLGPVTAVVLGPLATDDAGRLELLLRWPAAAPLATAWHLQAWLADAAAVEGWSASNVLTLALPGAP